MISYLNHMVLYCTLVMYFQPMSVDTVVRQNLCNYCVHMVLYCTLVMYFQPMSVDTVVGQNLCYYCVHMVLYCTLVMYFQPMFLLVGSSVRADPDKNVHSLLAGDLKRPATMDQHSALSLGDICNSKLIGVRNRCIFVSLFE
jgi:hypothetical protein